MPCSTWSRVTTTRGWDRPEACNRASSRGCVQEVAIATASPGSTRKASTAPGMGTTPVVSETSSSSMRAAASSQRFASGIKASVRARLGMLMYFGISFRSTPYSPAQRV